MRWNRVVGIGVGVMAGVAGLSCAGDGGPSAQVPTTLAIESGDGQTGAYDRALPNSLSVKVTDADGVPVADVVVTWTLGPFGGGSLSATKDTTNAQGLAYTRWSLGEGPDVSLVVYAEVVGLTGSPVTFHAKILPGPPAVLSQGSGNNQSGGMNATLAAPLVVMVFDAHGRAVPGVPVTWTVTSGGGSVSGSPVLTDAGGYSSVTWTLGPTLAANGAAAAAAGTTPASVGFVATATGL